MSGRWRYTAGERPDRDRASGQIIAAKPHRRSNAKTRIGPTGGADGSTSLAATPAATHDRGCEFCELAGESPSIKPSSATAARCLAGKV
jgi:hypothetical protein